MQATSATPTPAAAPAISTTTADGKTIQLQIPQSETDIAALHSRRQDIREQLSVLSQRRRSLVEEIKAAPDGVARTGLEQRVTVIDQNIVQYEKELGTIAQRLDAAPSELTQGYSEPSGDHGAYNDGWEEGMTGGIGGTLFALAVVWFFVRMRSRRRRKRNPAIEKDDSPRLERLEQGMEAIAIEIERISEGQRFVTKLLSESRDPIPSRIAQPAAQSAER